MKKKALDLYCGAGGATKGLQLAGFEVTGIDSKPQPRYIGDHFILKNVLTVSPKWINEHFDFVFASPPCQKYVPMSHVDEHFDLIPPTREILKQTDLPWIIENVPSAPLLRWIILCGTMFLTLRVIRHRKFEAGEGLTLRQPDHIEKSEHPKVYSFDRREHRQKGLSEDEDYVTVVGNNCSLGAASDAMGIHWMNRKEIAQAVPPAYTKLLGRQVLAA